MSDSDLLPRLSSPMPTDGLVPAGFAEKAMASLMQLHGELLEEKERRVDLYRRLMDREQQISELKAQVRVLEEKIALRTPAPAPAPLVRTAFVSAHRLAKPLPPPAPESLGARRALRVSVGRTGRPLSIAGPERVARPAASEPDDAPVRVDGWKAW